MKFDTDADAPTQNKLHEFILTSASDLTLSVDVPDEQADMNAWNDVINNKLIEWGMTPERLQDDGIEPPSPEAIQYAALLAIQLRDSGASAPDSVLPDGNGGIVFEKRFGSKISSFEIDCDGIECLVFNNGLQMHRSKVV